MTSLKQKGIFTLLAFSAALLVCLIAAQPVHAQSRDRDSDRGFFSELTPRFESLPSESESSFLFVPQTVQTNQTIQAQSESLFISDNNVVVAIVQSPAPPTRTVSGVILAEGRAFHDGVTVTIHPMGLEESDTIASSQSIITGLFVLELSEIPDGFYVLRFQKDGYLQHRELIALTEGADLLGVNAGKVVAGDLDGDNRIDREDVILMGIEYGHMGDFISDFNGNGFVDANDFALLDKNFGEVGE